MSAKPLKPTTINEIPFPGSTQEVGSGGISDTSTVYYPTNITPMSFPTVNIATGLRSTSFNSETRTINSNVMFQPLGAISIGTVRGTGTSLSGTGIRISPYGIYGYSSGSVTFSLNAITGAFVTNGYIQVGGAAGDVNAGVTLIAPGKVLISGSTTLATWRSGADATFIDGGKIYTDSITADKINVTTLSAITADMGTITAGTMTADRINGGTLNIGGSADALGIISVKNSSSTEIARINNNGVIIRNQRGLFFEGTTGGQYWDFQVNGSNQSVTSLATANQFFMKNYAGSTNLFTVSSADGGFFDKTGFALGNGSGTASDHKPRVVKCGTNGGHISADSFFSTGISFGYTFDENPFVVATVTLTNGSLGDVQEWNVSADGFSTTGCTLKCRHVNYSNGTGDIEIDWIAIGRHD